MNLEKQKNSKFNFFKSAPIRRSLGFPNAKDFNDYTSLVFICLWVLGGLFFKSDIINHAPTQAVPKIAHSLAYAPVSVDRVEVQKKLDLISKVKSLNGNGKYYFPSTQDISEKLGMVIHSVIGTERKMEVSGFSKDNKKIVISYTEDKAIVIWKNVSQKSVDDFSAFGKGASTVLSSEENKKIDLSVTVNRLLPSDSVVNTNLEADKLKEKIDQIQQENQELKKANAVLVVKQSLKEVIKNNPQLKTKEADLNKLLDSFIQKGSVP